MIKHGLLFLALLLASPSPPLQAAEGLAAAAQAFEAGDYDRAITLYEAAIADGRKSGHLYYNLGIAYYRKERLGDAMAAFLGARRLLPRDPDVKANLRFVTAKIRDKLEIEQPTSGFRALTFWTAATTPRELGWVFAVTGVLAGLGVALTVLVPRFAVARRWAMSGFAVPVAAAAALAISIGESERWGAVTARQTTVYSGPDKKTVLFELGEGAPFEAEAKSEQGFWRIALSDGKKGWVSGSDVKVF